MRKTWSIISDTLNEKVKHYIPDIMSVNKIRMRINLFRNSCETIRWQKM